MIGRFTKARQRRYIKLMIVWSIGMLLVVPLGMMIFPYLIDMPFERYGSSPLELFKQGGVFSILIIWIFGAIAALIAHILNPLGKRELPASREKSEENKI